mmetsp:Transcript_108046/g.345046  ORF Transcript_108046/g.345046 Transcript_108046/m.345046 type:complete len:216 (-) Transcript_108046:1020-1667(-)
MQSPPALRMLTVARRPVSTPTIKAVFPSRFNAALEAPKLQSNRTVSSCPNAADTCKGVWPRSVEFSFTDALKAHKALITSVNPCLAAMCKGVPTSDHPGTFVSARASHKYRATPVCPHCAAQCKAVAPSRRWSCKDALAFSKMHSTSLCPQTEPAQSGKQPSSPTHAAVPAPDSHKNRNTFKFACRAAIYTGVSPFPFVMSLFAPALQRRRTIAT